MSEPSVILPSTQLPVTQRAGIVPELTGVRVHELALQRWLNQAFHVVEGYPVPVIFAYPKDAYAHFTELWKRPNGPFSYLLNAKDAEGRPLYEPFPSVPRYPLITVSRKGIKYRPTQSYGSRLSRRTAYVTAAGTKTRSSGSYDLKRSDIGMVVRQNRPAAYDFTFQIDHYANHPASHAMFVEQLFRVLRAQAAGTLQAWLLVRYPSFFGDQYVRMTVSESIDQVEPQPDERNVDFRTSFSVTIEGYDPDKDMIINPALWKFVSTTTAIDPLTLETLYSEVTYEEDLRIYEGNGVFTARSNLPSE